MVSGTWTKGLLVKTCISKNVDVDLKNKVEMIISKMDVSYETNLYSFGRSRGGTQAANDLIMSWVWNDIASLDVLTASTNALAAAKLIYVKLWNKMK